MVVLGMTFAECGRVLREGSYSYAFRNEYSIFDEQQPSANANVLTVFGVPKGVDIRA
jgi:hypothetical protein